MLRLPRILHVEVHKVLRLPRTLHVKKQVNTLITMEGRIGDHRRQPQTTQHPQPLTEHGGSQSAAPATNSARQQTSEYPNHNGPGGTDRRPPQTTADNRRQPQTTQHPQPLTEHGGSQSAARRLPRILVTSRCVLSQSAAPATQSAHDLCVCCLGVCDLCVCDLCVCCLCSCCCLGVEGGGGKRAAGGG